MGGASVYGNLVLSCRCKGTTISFVVLGSPATVLGEGMTRAGYQPFILSRDGEIWVNDVLVPNIIPLSSSRLLKHSHNLALLHCMYDLVWRQARGVSDLVADV